MAIYPYIDTCIGRLGLIYILINQSATYLFGREEGIRTLDTVRYTRFPGELFQPLRHLSITFISAGFLMLLSAETPELAASSLEGGLD